MNATDTAALEICHIRLTIETIQQRLNALLATQERDREARERYSSPFWVAERGKVATERTRLQLSDQMLERHYKIKTLTEALAIFKAML